MKVDVKLNCYAVGRCSFLAFLSMLSLPNIYILQPSFEHTELATYNTSTLLPLQGTQKLAAKIINVI